MANKDKKSNNGEFLPVLEHFNTLQGEGEFAGHAAYFIRLAGCDVGCKWCDTKHSWKTTDNLMNVNELTEIIAQSKSDIVVVTGGEPTMHNLTVLADSIFDLDKQASLETSGVYDITGEWDWICLSPKKHKPPLLQNLKRADELKVVIENKEDINWAEEMAQKVSQDCVLSLQPEFSVSKEIIPYLIEFVKENPKWKLSLQLHKILDIP